MNQPLPSFISSIPLSSNRSNFFAKCPLFCTKSFNLRPCTRRYLNHFGTLDFTSNEIYITSLAPQNVSDTNTTTATETIDSLSSSQTLGFSDQSFIDAVSGEWFGYQVTFSSKTGEAKEIEERFVPEEYRNWGVSITGFDILTSTKVNTNKNSMLCTKLTRALPTVGCEADAIAGEITETFHSANLCNGGFPDGSYTIGPEMFDTNNLSQKFQVCITNPITMQNEGKSKRARVEFGRVDEKVSSVSVIIENWDAPYCGGAILPGCGGPDSSFANDIRLNPKELIGNWNIKKVIYDRKDNWQCKEIETSIEERPEDSKLLLLPRGLSVKVEDKDNENVVVVEAAWLVKEGRRTTIRRIYNKKENNMLERVEQIIETRK